MAAAEEVREPSLLVVHSSASRNQSDSVGFSRLGFRSEAADSYQDDCAGWLEEEFDLGTSEAAFAAYRDGCSTRDARSWLRLGDAACFVEMKTQQNHPFRQRECDDSPSSCSGENGTSPTACNDSYWPAQARSTRRRDVASSWRLSALDVDRGSPATCGSKQDVRRGLSLLRSSAALPVRVA
mmetsp:Transcript_11905/g.27769  ORF Transcript_11905/g.27769 Transcript_11905/m.27769 type:complete len:182 (-) Transcript_11905:285-830(-)